MAGVLMRLVGGASGALVVWLGLVLAHPHYEERVHRPQAPLCTEAGAAASPHGCLGRTRGRVLDKGEGMGPGWVRLRWASGAEKRYHVEAGLSSCTDAVRRGAHAELETWRGGLVRFTVRGETCEVSPNAGVGVLLSALVAWTGVGVILACLTGRRVLDLPRLGVRVVAWLGICLFACFPVVRLAAGGVPYWMWVLCLPPAALCALLAFLPLTPRRSVS